MAAFFQDLRYALSALVSRPLYASVSIALLAIAIGANTTMFSLFSGFLLRPLPFPDEDRLVRIYNTYPKIGVDVANTSIPDYVDRREQAPSLESVGILTYSTQTLSEEGAPERVRAGVASPSLFDVLGIAPLVGRRFTVEEGNPGNDRVVMLSHRLWTTRFRAQAGVIGRDVELDGETFRVIGVLPEKFGFPEVDLWRPLAFSPEEASDAARGHEYVVTLGRLRPDATIEGLNAELYAIVERNADRIPEGREYVERTGFTGRARLLREMVVGDRTQMLKILQATVLAVLLIACANLANLQLARTAARRRELSLRAALGADGIRLAALVLVESLLLAAAGCLGGLLLSLGGMEIVRGLGIGEGFEFVLDWRVMLFAAAAAVLAALTAGLLPALSVLRSDAARALQHTDRPGAGGRSSPAFRNALVVVQLALTGALLVGGGLLAKSFYKLQHEDVGFNAASVWSASIALPESYVEAQSTARFFERALDELSALPGVTEAGYTSSLPFSGSESEGSNVIEGRTETEPHSHQRIISEGYLRALGIPVVSGRHFAPNESVRVAIVDEIMADRYWPDGDVLGQRVRNVRDPEDRWHTVVGVAAAVKHSNLAEDPSTGTIYWHYKQRPSTSGHFTLRGDRPAEQFADAARAVVAAIDPGVPLFDVMSMDERLAGSLGPQRTPTVLTLAFAAIAFVLASIGLYSMLSWSVAQRTGEIGVRMALGARSSEIVGMILLHGGRLIVLGLVLGVAAGGALGRALSSQIHEVSPYDPAVFGAALLGLMVVALLASWLPARRASRIDPMHALREE